MSEERNAGIQVTTDQRECLQFALVTDVVKAGANTIKQSLEAIAATQAVRDLHNQLAGFHLGIPLPQFRDLVEVTDVDAQSRAVNERIVEAQNIRLIQAKAFWCLLAMLTLNFDRIFETFESSLAGYCLWQQSNVSSNI